jgi:hypothetical protein
MAMSAILGFGKSAGLNEIVGFGGGVTGECEVLLAETKIVRLANFFRVIRAVEGVVGLNAGAEMHRSQDRGGAKYEADDEAD